MPLPFYLRKAPVPCVSPHTIIGNWDVVDSRESLVEQSGLFVTLKESAGLLGANMR